MHVGSRFIDIWVKTLPKPSNIEQIKYFQDIDVIIPLRPVSTAQRQNTQHSQHQTYYQPRYPTRKTIYPRSWAV